MTTALLFTACTSSTTEEKLIIRNFEECEKSGAPIMELYPRQCKYEDKIFTENTGIKLKVNEAIKIDSPRPNQIISSPLKVTGEAVGYWFFEATFPVEIVDENNNKIAEHYAMATEEWMTNDFVNFETTIDFDLNENLFGKKGKLILKNDNPSGFESNVLSLEIPIVFSEK